MTQRVPLVVVLVTGVAGLFLGSSSVVASASAAPGALVQVIPGFNHPLGISSDGTNVWVANSGANSVAKLSASTGPPIVTFSDSSYGFDYPVGISSDGTHVWVANYDPLGGNTVTDVLDGVPISEQTTGENYMFNGPWAISSDGTNVWVADYLGGSVTEMSTSTDPNTGLPGGLVQVIPGFAGPSAISSDGTHVWVANSGDNSVTELSASSAAIIQNLSDPSYGFDDPSAISSDGTHVWVANSEGNSVTELSAATGALIQNISGSSYAFNNPMAISSDGSNVWVANYAGDSVTALSVCTGALVQNLSGSSYGFNAPSAISSDGTHVWVANYDAPQGGSSSVTELSAGGSPAGCPQTPPPTATTTPASTDTSATATPMAISTATTTPVPGSIPLLVGGFHGVSAAATGVWLTLTCTGSAGSCPITALMSVVETTRADGGVGVGARARTTRRSVVVGRARIAVPAGTVVHTFLVRLNGTGARLLRTRRRLSVQLQISSGSLVLHRGTVTIRLASRVH